MTKQHELLGVPKHANQHRLSRLTMEVHTDELRILATAVESYTDALIAALEHAHHANAAQDDHINQQAVRIENLEKKNAEIGRELSRYAMSPGQADQRMCESRVVRDALGFGKDADNVAPIDLRTSIESLKSRIAGLESTLELEREKSRRVMSQNHQLEASPLAVKLPADSIDYKALVLQIAEIAHGGPVDIGLLPVTVRSMQQLAGKIPDNWVLVPKSPTRGMVTAVATGMSMSPIHCYERMIAAAPKPEV